MQYSSLQVLHHKLNHFLNQERAKTHHIAKIDIFSYRDHCNTSILGKEKKVVEQCFVFAIQIANANLLFKDAKR